MSLDNAEYLDAATRDRELDSMAAMGADWVRFDVKWSDVQWDGPASFNWSKYDPLVDAARARGLSVLANLAYSPTWARPGGTTDKFGPDTDDRRSAYAAFTEAAVRHFAGRVSHWELWNEPNMSMFWAPRPNAAHYTALIREAYGRMKSADPGAYVLAGATSPADSDGTRIDEVAFISAVYANGGRGHFDGWSHHPYTVDRPSRTRRTRGGRWPAPRRASAAMSANGDGAKQLGDGVRAADLGAPHAMSEAAQAAQITEAYTTWNAYGWSGRCSSTPSGTSVLRRLDGLVQLRDAPARLLAEARVERLSGARDLSQRLLDLGDVRRPQELLAALDQRALRSASRPGVSTSRRTPRAGPPGPAHGTPPPPASRGGRRGR